MHMHDAKCTFLLEHMMRAGQFHNCFTEGLLPSFPVLPSRFLITKHLSTLFLSYNFYKCMYVHVAISDS